MHAFNSPLEAFQYWEKQRPNAIFLKQPIDGKITTYTFAQAGEESRKIANAIKNYNLPERSHIALLSKNCAHWHMADLAIMMSGHVSIPIYPTLNADSIHQILEHSESKAIIIGKLDDFESQQSGIPDIPQICVGLYDNSNEVLWENIVSEGQEITDIYSQKPDDLHTIIYTSGTTGIPKGVMHTVNNVMVSVYDLMSIFPLEDNCKLFSYLPIAHIAERTLENISFVFGSTVTFPESLASFATNLEQTQPRVFFAVPRIWTKFQEKILEKLPQKKLSTLLKIPIIRGIIKKKLHKKLGLGEAKFALSGAAPLAPSVVSWFESIGITIFQVYGMTEDCVISHCNKPGANKEGTVGKAMSNASIKLSPESEICIKNKCMMKGYFKAPEITASVFDEEEFFKTGDIGEYDHDGFLTITGRVKDQFKTDKGKYISPAPIELQMSKNTDIEQICVVGTGIPQPIALITLSELGKAKSNESLCTGLIDTVNQINPNFEKHEKIQKVIIMKEDWNVANGLTTPTLKVKRNSIEKIHQQFYKSWFDKEEQVIFE
ncbi:MAG: AMP-binding protein [Cyclobacteriaceae bacterium]|nr:AMP-binding protein [Cyclobacteriaceae bacterium]